MIEASGEEILVDHLLAGKTIFGDVRIVGDGPVRQMIKSPKVLGVWIQGYGHRISVRVVNQTVTGIERWNGSERGDALGLTNSLVVGKEKCSLWNDWPTDRSTKLVALERRDLRAVEEIPRVQRAVAEEFVSAPVKSARTRPRDSVNDAA